MRLQLTKFRPAFIFALAMSALLVPLAALAQAADPSQPDFGQLFSQLAGVFGSWKTAGAIAGSIALVNLFVNLTKLGALDSFFNRKVWLRPLLAVVFGCVLTCLGAIASGQALPAALLAGVFAGLSSAGFHEFITAMNPSKQTERALGAQMGALAKSDGSIQVQVDAAKAHLDNLAALPDSASRLAAMAAFAKSNPPPAAP